jgi:hypothetical protein
MSQGYSRVAQIRISPLQTLDVGQFACYNDASCFVQLSAKQAAGHTSESIEVTPGSAAPSPRPS